MLSSATKITATASRHERPVELRHVGRRRRTAAIDEADVGENRVTIGERHGPGRHRSSRRAAKCSRRRASPFSRGEMPSVTRRCVRRSCLKLGEMVLAVRDCDERAARAQARGQARPAPGRDPERGRASRPRQRSRTRRRRTEAPGRRRRVRRRRGHARARPCAPSVDRDDRRAQLARCMRAASSPGPQPTSRTRRGATSATASKTSSRASGPVAFA